MKKRNRGFSRCQTCSGQFSSKKSSPRPYGATGTNPYCAKCDRDYTYKVSKSAVRKKAKRIIQKELDEKA